ncbi:MAG: lipoprotein [marine bacterium B5-7]|nr:MAG: lipoprotein [marine bacterium B5-7]
MKKLFCTLLSVCLLAACHQKEAPNALKVGVIAGPEAEIMQVAKQQAAKSGVTIKVIEFTDYAMPNQALSDGSIDANMFQHLPYLKQAMKARGYQFNVLGKTFIYPMGVYSNKIKSLKALPAHALVAIPNDPSNEARALLLLQSAGLLQLKSGAGWLATPRDIKTNPKQLQFKELDAADLARTLPDVSIAVINTNYAIPAGLSLNQALLHEQADSPYANLVVVRANDKRTKQLNILIQSLHSQAVFTAAKHLFHGAAMPAKNDKLKQ